MKSSSFALFAIFSLFSTKISQTQAATEPSLIKRENCVRENQGEEIVRSSLYEWGMSLSQIKEKEKELYERGLRLKERAFTENGQAYLPFTPYGGEEQKVKLSDRFIKSVIKHVEEGLKRGYIDSLIFPDMGHSHLFVDREFYENKVKSIPVKETHRKYELMLNHPETRFLYHTAEQLSMVNEDRSLKDDRKLQWRFFTRNLVGGNKALGKIELLHNEEHQHNTARDYDEGYRYWGAGYYIHGTKKGCFSYQREGKTFYFDLSLKSLEP